jgi:uncharacterized protein YaaR (DUF327 family)
MNSSGGGGGGKISDMMLLETIIIQNKGKKLLSKVFKLLPSQGCVMLPLTLKTIYSELPLNKNDIQNNNSSSSSSSSQNNKLMLLNKLECEEMILTSCLNIINAPPTVNPTTMVAKPLMNFNTVKSCMEGIISPHVVNKTLAATLHSKQRVDLVQALMKKGEELISDETEANVTYWKTLVKAFYDLAKSSPAAASS